MNTINYQKELFDNLSNVFGQIKLFVSFYESMTSKELDETIQKSLLSRVPDEVFLKLYNISTSIQSLRTKRFEFYEKTSHLSTETKTDIEFEMDPVVPLEEITEIETTSSNKTINTYQQFVKDMRPIVLKKHPDLSGTDILKEIGKRWKETKNEDKKETKNEDKKETKNEDKKETKNEDKKETKKKTKKEDIKENKKVETKEDKKETKNEDKKETKNEDKKVETKEDKKVETKEDKKETKKVDKKEDKKETKNEDKKVDKNEDKKVDKKETKKKTKKEDIKDDRSNIRVLDTSLPSQAGAGSDMIEKEKISSKTKKMNIPKYIKTLVWNTYIGEAKPYGECTACNVSMIRNTSFHCGHVIAESKGGDQTIGNLRPICPECNSAMGTMSMRDFVKKYFGKDI
jgi:hypothetical protein